MLRLWSTTSFECTTILGRIIELRGMVFSSNSFRESCLLTLDASSFLSADLRLSSVLQAESGHRQGLQLSRFRDSGPTYHRLESGRRRDPPGILLVRRRERESISSSLLLLAVADSVPLLSLQFERHLPALYPIATDILLRESAPEVREALRLWFVKAGRARFGAP